MSSISNGGVSESRPGSLSTIHGGQVRVAITGGGTDEGDGVELGLVGVLSAMSSAAMSSLRWGCRLFPGIGTTSSP